MEALREQSENTICSTREDLYSAQEEVRHPCARQASSQKNSRHLCVVPGVTDPRPAARRGGGHGRAGAGHRRPAGGPGQRALRELKKKKRKKKTLMKPDTGCLSEALVILTNPITSLRQLH